ncbi:MAG: hypothetical protein NVSMB9_09920 [Isosphaeraceae bacterium]
MKPLQLIWISLLTTFMAVAAPGCRTAGVDNLTGREPLPPSVYESAADLLVEHNRNAERVQSIVAKPSITVAQRRSSVGVSGKLAMERPRNFKLVLSGPIHDVADIGSNDQEFWFWVKDSQEKAVYYCNYDESGESPLSAGLQPDWIVESLGLRVIPDEELSRIKVSPGPEPGTLLLTQRQTNPQGGTLLKETILSASTHRILKHRLFSSDRKTLLANATVKEYQDYPVSFGDDPSTEKVYLPRKLRLEWGQEKLALDVVLSGVKINTKFDAARRQDLFVEPVIDGFARINLAGRSGLASSPTSVRETMPAPPPRVRLKGLAPLGMEGSGRTPRAPTSLAAALPISRTSGLEKVVGPPIPTVSEPFPQNARTPSNWRSSLAPGLER